MLTADNYSLLTFVETWHLSLNKDFTTFFRNLKYNILHLPAQLSLAGHNKGGIIVLVKQNVKLSSIMK